MKQIRRVAAKVAGLFRNKRTEAELAREIAAHLALLEDEFRARGMTAEEARLAARRAYGGVEQAKQMHRNERSILWLERTRQNVRYALRQLRKSPGFTAVAVGTLALGIGGVTSVFSVVNGVLLKPFALREPEKLVVVRETTHGSAKLGDAFPDSYRHYLRLKATTKTLEDAAIIDQHGVSVALGNGHPQIESAVQSSPNLFRLLGVRPLLGRDFVDADAQKGAAPVVLLSYAGWQTLFAGNPAAVGQTLRLGMAPSTVIGVLPPGLRFPQIALSPDVKFEEMGGQQEPMIYSVFLPDPTKLTDDTGQFNYKVIGRLRAGVSAAEAQAELDGLQQAYSAAARLPVRYGAVVTAMAKDVTAGVSRALWLLLAAVAGVLLIGCVNLANLQLARAMAAEQETAVRAALGANRGQLVMARLTESLLLGVAGGAAGAGLAFAGVRALMALAPGNIPRADQVTVNGPVLAFAAAVSIAAAVLFGILPALRSLGVAPQAALKTNSTRAGASREGGRTRMLLVAAEVACTLVLLIVTSLVLRSFGRLLNENRGFDASQLTAMQVDLYAQQYSDSNPNVDAVKREFVERTQAALEQLPGVQAVGLTSAMPMTGETWIDGLERPDHPLPDAEVPMVNVRWIDPGYFRTMGISLRKGRIFTNADQKNGDVALISERTARVGFPDTDPVGKTITGIDPNDNKKAITVIGVVADTRINGLKDMASMVYMPYWTFTPWRLTFLVRTTEGAATLMPAMRRAAWSVDPQVAIPTIKSMDEQVGDSVAAERFQADLLTGFAACGLLLALIGVYGVMAYSVSLRRQEFGIRIALGSQKSALMGLVLRQAALPVLLGAAAGLGLSFVAMRWVRSLLYQTSASDPLAIFASVAALLAVAAVAALLPARQAAGVDPVRVLRTQ
jgi:predicted permease